jgi:aldose 1-epimerase
LSKDGEEGYPGNLNVEVIYTFNENAELRIDYKIISDKPTIKNITNHAYFNLSGNLKNDILKHEIIINGDYFLPIAKGLIPTGEIRKVKDTPMDFKTTYKIGERIDHNDEQLKLGFGYDHNWIINKTDDALDFAASVYDPSSGRLMDVYTTEPGIQFYSGNFLNGSHIGHNNKVHKYRSAFCLETQHFPDSPNHNHFPSCIIRPGEIYKSATIYKFSIR